MSKSFAELKKSSKSSLDKLNQELAKLNPSTQYSDDDEKFWRPETDKVGNGEAIVRFLPAPAGEDVPFVRVFNHSFKGPTGSWYIENSLTTIGKPDPVSEYNTQLWNSGSDEDKKQAREQKRKLTFVSNVYVIRDKANPSNEGKVFKFRYGKKIFDKLNALMNPEFEDETPVNPFDLWEGANFRIKIKQVEGYRNYDSSKFDDAAPLFDDDEKLESVWKQTHSLQSHVAPDQFKSYDELKAKLHRVLALDTPAVAPKANKKVVPWEDEVEEVVPVKKTAAPKKQAVVKEEDDDLEAFKKLMDDED